MKFLSVFFVVVGVINEIQGFIAYLTANGVIQQIAGLCFVILGTLQFILARFLWPKKSV